MGVYKEHACEVCNQIKIIMKGMFYENGLPSFTRVLALIGYLTFIIGSFYLMIKGIHWEDYSIFASYTGGGGVALQFANKFINSKYNSVIGSYQQRDYCDNQYINNYNMNQQKASNMCNGSNTNNNFTYDKDPNIGTK